MKTATVRDLRNHYTDLLDWVKAGEEVLITQRGKPVARLVPEKVPPTAIDWSASPAVSRDRTSDKTLTSAESLEILKESSGKW